MIRAFKWLAVFTLAIGLAVLCIVSITVIGKRRTISGHDINSAQRFMAYRVDRKSGPRFSIDPGAVVKLLVVAKMPATTVNQRLQWGIEISVVHPNGARDGANQRTLGSGAQQASDRGVWQHVVYMESRQSRDGDIRGTYDLQGDEYTDERELELVLPAEVAGEMSLRLVSDESIEHILARVFSSNPRQVSGVAKMREQLATSIEKDSTSRIDIAPVVPHAALLPPQAVDHRLALRFTKLLPIGDSGSDYQVKQILIGTFRQPPPERVKAIQHVISRSSWLALNLRGPGRLLIRQIAGPQKWYVGGSVRPTQPRAADDSLVVIAVSDQLTSIWLQSDSEIADTIAIESEGVTQISTHFQSGDVVAAPDTVRIPVEIVDASNPLTLSIVEAPLRQGIESAIRIDVRQLQPAASLALPAEPSSTHLSLTFRDSNGTVLLQQTSSVTALLSPFEKIAVDGELVGVTEPQFLRMLPPTGCKTVTITSSTPTALRFARLLPLADKIDEPYASALGPRGTDDDQVEMLTAQRWRYARMETRQWQPFFSMRYSDRNWTQPRAALLAQVRLVEHSVEDQLLDGKTTSHSPTVASSQPSPLDQQQRPPAIPILRSLVPYGDAEQQRIREVVDGEHRAAVLADWPNDAVTVLPPGAPMRIGLTRNGDGPTIGWRCDAAQLGDTASVLLDGVEVSAFDLTTTSGSWTLPAGLAGDHELSVRVSDKVTLWINRPPTGASIGSSKLLRMRTVWALSKASLAVRVPQQQGRNVSVYAIVYAAGVAADDSIAMRFTVGGGNPSRKAGLLPSKLTQADRKLTLPAASALQRNATFVDRPSTELGLPRVIRLGLLDDLRGGTQLIAAYNQSRKPLWVRFVSQTMDAAPAMRTGVKITRALE